MRNIFTGLSKTISRKRSTDHMNTKQLQVTQLWYHVAVVSSRFSRFQVHKKVARFVIDGFCGNSKLSMQIHNFTKELLVNRYYLNSCIVIIQNKKVYISIIWCKYWANIVKKNEKTAKLIIIAEDDGAIFTQNSWRTCLWRQWTGKSAVTSTVNTSTRQNNLR